MEKNYDENDFLNYSYKFQLGDEEFYNYDESYNNAVRSLKMKYNRDNKNNSWRNFIILIGDKRIRIAKKPTSLLGWFVGEESTKTENLDYTFRKYMEGISRNKELEKIKLEQERKDEEISKKIRESLERSSSNLDYINQIEERNKLRKEFTKKYPRIIEIYETFVIENIINLNNILNDLLVEQNHSESEVNEILIRGARKKYNFEIERNNENIKNYTSLSAGMKLRTKNNQERLEKFFEKLKPLVKEYDERINKISKPEEPLYKKETKPLYKNETKKEELLKVSELLKDHDIYYSWKYPEDNNLDRSLFNLIFKYESAEPYWDDFESLVREKKIRILKKPYEEGWFFSSRPTYSENIDYTFQKYKELLPEVKTTKNFEKQELERAQQELKDLNAKVLDAQGRYALNVGKLKVVEFKFQRLEKFRNRRNELTEKLRKKNLDIEERKQLLKEKTELNEKLANMEKLENQVANLKSKIPDASIFEQEKTLRENELRKLKNLNDASIREKNALLKSIEFEKILSEIRLREQQRYEQEQREKEELKQAKIVFLKEKQITQRKLNILEKEHKYFNDMKIETQKYEKEITEKKQEIQSLLSQTRTHLQNVKLEAEQKKLKTLELQKKTLQNKQDLAEQQKLFADSIQRDVDALNEQKNILQKLSLENQKILKNTKDEIRKKQQEIEKTIKLNLETLKKREADILSEESKIKLDVFYTLEDVKEQTALKLEHEKKLQDLKDEIMRKQDVENLLSETVDKISNNEVLEVEEYNSFLKSEIEFKQKLNNTLLTQKQVLQILTEEKQSYLDLLKDTKSQFLQDLLNTKRDIIEKNIRIALVEGKENLSYVTSSMKAEIESLQKEKEINLRRKELVEFQRENYKKELDLRKQEIELLKKIRIKALQNEWKIIRNEATSAISDMIKSIEKTERDSDVREKLDEMLDDVENKEISKNSKATLFSLIDKIEEKEIHDAAKEKLDFILGKIELHDNIDESKKALDKILDKIEDKQIRQDVETKLDEILDDVELEDYDFLDEEDDFDIFLSNVKKHISGEKKMEQLSKIDEIFEEAKKEDSKLKMSENIEMKDRSQRIDPEDYEVGETSFAEFDDYNLFINNIEDPIMRERTRLILNKEDGFDKNKPPKMKNAYTKAIKALWAQDKLDTDYWDGNIILEEHAKLLYEQKVNNLNTALTDYDLHVDPKDMTVREFLDIKLQNSLSEKKGEINGYIYNGEKIISRNISRNFYFNYIKKPAVCQQFIDELKRKINNKARSQIANVSLFEGDKAVKDCAMEYIGELREEQSYQMESARNGKEMKQALRDGNDIEKEIKDIKKNISFKMRLKIFKKTLSWRITKLLRFLWKHKGKTGAGVATLLLTVLGVVMNQLGVIGIVHNLKKASAAVKQYANDVHDMGRKIIQNVQALYRVPGTIIGYTMLILAVFLRILYFATRLSGTYSSAAVFGALGVTFEALIYFEGSADKINEKVADAMEETGNIIEDFGIRAEKRIVKQMPRWYWDKPTNEKTFLEIIESGAAKMTLSIARGTQKAGKKVEEAGEIVRSSIWYLKIFVLIATIFLTIIFVRNYIL